MKRDLKIEVPMEIKTKRLLLREVLPTDLDFIHSLNSIPEVEKYNTLGIPATIDVTKQLTDEIILSQTANPRIRYVFLIANSSTNELMGLCGLVMGKLNYRNAEIWYKLHPQAWNKGFATEAVAALLDFGFNTLQLHRIEAGCATGNSASINVLEKSNFTREAHTRKLLPIRGVWTDNFGYAILEEDYFNKIG